MNVVLWILQGVLAAVILMTGVMKAAKGKEMLLEESKMGWAADFSDQAIRTIGWLEILAALGLVLPWALRIAPVLTPSAAVGVIALMLGAMYTHRRHSETQMLALNVVVALIATIVAFGRFAEI